MSYQGPVIDVHTHVFWADGERYPLPPGRPEGIDTQLRLAEEAGITISGVIVMAPKGDLDQTRTLNDRVIELQRTHASRLFAIGSVHPDDGSDALAELERIAVEGVRVLKLHPNTQAFDVAAPEVAAVVSRAGELGLTVLFDAYSPFDANQPGKFAMLAMANPGTRLILAHMGGPKFHEMMIFNVLGLYPEYARNVWFDISATVTMFADGPYAPHLAWVARKLGIDRILFGSDFPYASTPAEALIAIRSLGFDENEERQVLHDNASALLAV